MGNLIEHEGKKHKVVSDFGTNNANVCHQCSCRNTDMCYRPHLYGFPHCINKDCHFELVEETNQKKE